MAEHSALPWTWHAKSIDQAHNGSIYRMERPGHAYAIAMQPRYVDDDRFSADAAYIVKACNAYPDLMKALEEIAARARFELEMPTEMRDTAFSLIEKCARGALAAVGSPATPESQR